MDIKVFDNIKNIVRDDMLSTIRSINGYKV